MVQHGGGGCGGAFWGPHNIGRGVHGGAAGDRILCVEEAGKSLNPQPLVWETCFQAATVMDEPTAQGLSNLVI